MRWPTYYMMALRHLIAHCVAARCGWIYIVGFQVG